MSDERTPDNLLHGTICMQLMTAGILGNNGQHPECLEHSCSQYSICVSAVLRAEWEVYQWEVLYQQQREGQKHVTD